METKAKPMAGSTGGGSFRIDPLTGDVAPTTDTAAVLPVVKPNAAKPAPQESTLTKE